jgi:hypothetical protein
MNKEIEFEWLGLEKEEDPGIYNKGPLVLV